MSKELPFLTRRAVLGAAAAVPGAMLLGAAASHAAPDINGAGAKPGAGSQSGPPVRGVDMSFTPQLEAVGATWRRKGREAPVEQIFRQAGANWMRIRVWVDPPAGYSTLETATALALRAKKAGMKVLLDLHYSDFWADPAHQSTPASWAGQDLNQLAATVEEYTRDAVEALSNAGAHVDMVQVGNEITSGMLWPLGKLYNGSPDQNWPGFTRLLGSGLAGVRSARVKGPKPRTMVHIDRGGDNGGSRYFFDRIVAAGLEFDVIGQSYYPFWHGTLEKLEQNLSDLAVRYDKDLIVVETAYPWTLENGDELENILDRMSELPQADTWPPTPEGQLAYFAALRGVFAKVPNGHGLGFMCWEPEWVPGVGWTPGEGNPNDNLTLFDFQGNSLPALAALTPGALKP